MDRLAAAIAKIGNRDEFLAAKGAQRDCVDRYHLSGSPSPHALSNLKSRLCKLLIESEDSASQTAAQLATHIEHSHGEMRLQLAPDEIKVIELSGYGADEWNLDPAEFDVTG